MTMNTSCRFANELMALAVGGAVVLFGLQQATPAGAEATRKPAPVASEAEAPKVEPGFSKTRLGLQLQPAQAESTS